MRKLFFLLFIICCTPIFSQEFSGINQSNYSGALGVDFNPANLDGFLDNQLIGSPCTIAGKLEEYRDLGFNHFILNCAREGWPAELRTITMQRFAREIAPGFKN